MATDLPNFSGFDWDIGKREKNSIKHGVSDGESEEIFFNSPLAILDDEKHSLSEKRFAAFGRTNAGKKLIVVFTMRENSIRVISARNMNKREQGFYSNYEKTS